MLTRQISIATPIFLMIFVIQESVISQFRLPGGGFSILLIFALTWAVLSETEVAAVIGFAAGFLMDLSQASPPGLHRNGIDRPVEVSTIPACQAPLRTRLA